MNTPHAPQDYSRRILLAVTGLTPQVVTETLYALAASPAPTFVPTEIHLITTTEGAERARLSLLDPTTGQFHALCRDYRLTGIEFAAENIHTIPDADGVPLADIRTPEDNTLAADCLLGHVRRLCADETCALHVSIAGGRKTMGFFLGYALSLFGRAQDRLSHVLVSEPFESLTDFYFPPKNPRVLHTRDGRPVHTADARIMLAEIPFVRLRDGLPKEALQHPTPFASLVAAAQAGVGAASLEFDFDRRVAICGGTAVRLSPALLTWYAWLQRQADFVGHRHADPAGYLELYARIVGPAHPSLATARATLKNGFDAPFFEQKTSKLNRELRAALSLAAEPWLVRTQGERPNTLHGLSLSLRRAGSGA
ncbi:MAG: CRISPR-associated ring nuclease Csm6 [Sulfuritalea sp.]|nr:CRISPR-associated ring nuclease Csm6 [Sulfuritalea sp.]